MNTKNKKVVMCAALACVAMETLAQPGSQWSLNDLQKIDEPHEEEDRFDAIGAQLINSQTGLQHMANAWFALAENIMNEEGERMIDVYRDRGLESFIEIQQSASVGAGACYVACYGNCYANCYQNCYKNCHGADS